MQHRRTLTVGATPSGLVEGQISVGMGDVPATLWVGVPTSVNPAGVIQLLPPDFTGLVTTGALTTTLANYLLLAGGTMTAGSAVNNATLNQPRIMGVTDGSFGGPGEVGEVLWSGTVNTTSSASWTAATLTLTPGDWDVVGSTTMGGVTTYLTLTLAVGPTQALLNLNPGSLTNPSVYVGPFQISNTTSAVATLTGSATAGLTAGSFIRARRMR